MKDRVEPPVLISRLMAFVFAGGLAVFGTMLFTIDKIFPLSRPQVFILRATIRDDQDIKLAEFPQSDEYLDLYKYAFIYEYIRQRNEIFPNFDFMISKWNADDGSIKRMSNEDVYKNFSQTDMFGAIMGGKQTDLNFSCRVNFEQIQYKSHSETYLVNFFYSCSDDNAGQTPEKKYTIEMKIVGDDTQQIKWVDRIENPLGLKVASYKIVSGNGDPLDTGWRDTETIMR